MTKVHFHCDSCGRMTTQNTDGMIPDTCERCQNRSTKRKKTLWSGIKIFSLTLVVAGLGTLVYVTVEESIRNPTYQYDSYCSNCSRTIFCYVPKGMTVETYLKEDNTCPYCKTQNLH